MPFSAACVAEGFHRIRFFRIPGASAPGAVAAVMPAISRPSTFTDSGCVTAACLVALSALWWHHETDRKLTTQQIPSRLVARRSFLDTS